MSDLKEKVINEIKKVYDPEIPVNIYELGLIYKLEINNKNVVNVDMTLTTPNCPVADSLPKQVKEYILKVKGVSDDKWGEVPAVFIDKNKFNTNKIKQHCKNYLPKYMMPKYFIDFMEKQKFNKRNK